MFNGLAQRTTRTRRFELTTDRTVKTMEYRDWRIEVTTRRVGMTIRRQQITLIIQHELLEFEEKRPGFSSVRTAVEEAQRRIDYLIDIAGVHQKRRQRRTDQAHRR